MDKNKRGLCPGCGRVHYMSSAGRGTRQNTLSLTLKGWWAYDVLRRQRCADTTGS